MRHIIILLFFLFQHFFTTSQNIDWKLNYYPPCFWTSSQLANNGTTKLISTDTAGNIFSGKFYRHCKYGSSIAKHSSSGQLIWAFRLDSGYVDLQSLKVDPVGNCYITAHFFNTVNINGTILSDSLSYGKSFYAKLDPNGNCLWSYKLPPRVLFREINITDNGRILLIGETGNYTAVLGNDTVVSGCNFIMEINSSGSILWAKAIAKQANCKFVRTDAAGNFYVAGDYTANLQIGMGISPIYLTGSNPESVFIAKYDASLSPLWAKRGYTYGGRLNGLEVDQAGNVFSGGTLGYFFVMDSINIQTSGSNMFLLKLSPMGIVSWIKNSDILGNNIALNTCNGLALDKQGNCYVTGATHSDTTKFDNFTVTNKYSPYLIKYDPNGNILWGLNNQLIDYETANPNNYEGCGKSVHLDYSGNVFVCGFASTSYGKSFLTKISKNTIASITETNTKDFEINVFPNPTVGIFNISFNLQAECNLHFNIINTKGQIIYTELIHIFKGEYSKNIDLSKQAKGIYFVEIIADKKRFVKRVVLN